MFHLDRAIGCAIAVLLTCSCSETVPPVPKPQNAAPPVKPAAVSPAPQQARPAPPSRPSAWLDAERARHIEILAGAAPGGTLVLPFQSFPEDAGGPVSDRRGSIDPRGRLVMARLVANHLSAGGERVPDPGLLASAVQNLRAIAAHEVRTLVRATGARRVIVGHAGWTSGPAITPPVLLRVTAKLLDAGFTDEDYAAASKAPGFESNATQLNPALTPEQALSRDLPVLVAAIGVSGSIAPPPGSALRRLQIPTSPLTIPDSAAKDPIERAWIAQLLGVTSPPFSGQSRERFFEASLADALPAVHRDEDARLLAARAMFELGRRPAGVALMADRTKSADERFLLARLNGDLPAMEQEINGIQRPIARLIAELDLYAMKSWYGQLRPDNKAKAAEIGRVAKSAPANWQPLVIWTMESRDNWSRHSPVETKAYLDVIAPIQGFTIEDAARAKAIVGKDPMESADFLVAGNEHAKRSIASLKNGTCCVNATASAYKAHALGMIADWTYSWVAHYGSFLGEVQGRPRDAIGFLESFEAGPLQGHPGLAYARAEIYEILERGNEPDGAKRKAYEDLRQAAHQILQWASSQDDATAYAFAKIGGAPPAFGYDHPSQPIWANRTATAPARFKLSEPEAKVFRESRHRHACEHAIFFSPCGSLIAFVGGRSPKEAASIATQLADRFRGNTEAARYAANAKRESGDTAGELDALKAVADQKPDQPEPLLRYSAALSKLGRHKEAAAIGQRVVELGQRATGSDVVGYSGYVGAVADYLLLGGAIDEARPLLTAASRWQDGSARNMQTQSRLAIMDGRLAEAARHILPMVTRYQNQDAAFRYVSLLHVLGASADADAARLELAKGNAASNVAIALPVGWRREPDGLAAMRGWFDREIKTAGKLLAGEWRPAMFRLGLQDRSPKDIEAFRDAYVRMATPTGTKDDAGMKKTFSSHVTHEPLRYVDGYAALKAGKAAEAATIFAPIYKRIYLQPEAAAFLPYYVYAGAKGGDAGAANARNTDTPPNSAPNPFWTNLGDAIRAAFAGKHDEAMQKLLLAKANRYPFESLLLDEGYVVADIAEMLYEDTKHAPYLDFALDWARNMQRYEPWSSWTYALEAKHAKKDEDRIRALAIAQHLDRRSVRLQGFDDKSRAKAAEWFAKSDPFGIKRSSAPAKRPQGT